VRSIIRAACLALVLPIASRGYEASESAPSARHQLNLPRDLVGCYALFDRRGRPASDSLYFAPSHVRLDSAALPSVEREDLTGDRWARTKLDASLQPVHGERDRRPPSLYWTAEPNPERVRMMFHTGFSGTELIFDAPRTRDTLRGRALQHWDFGPPFTTKAGRVTAVRVPCSDSTSDEVPLARNRVSRGR
jgi:hypothetical protein